MERISASPSLRLWAPLQRPSVGLQIQDEGTQFSERSSPHPLVARGGKHVHCPKPGTSPRALEVDFKAVWGSGASGDCEAQGGCCLGRGLSGTGLGLPPPPQRECKVSWSGGKLTGALGSQKSLQRSRGDCLVLRFFCARGVGVAPHVDLGAPGERMGGSASGSREQWDRAARRAGHRRQSLGSGRGLIREKGRMPPTLSGRSAGPCSVCGAAAPSPPALRWGRWFYTLTLGRCTHSPVPGGAGCLESQKHRGHSLPLSPEPFCLKVGYKRTGRGIAK